jgi:phosphotransferase system HPr-like phosphotransfer protein
VAPPLLRIKERLTPAPAGKVKSADQAKKEITLEDGTKVMIPTTVQVSWAELKPGKTVLISYSGTAQQMTVKKVEVK